VDAATGQPQPAAPAAAATESAPPAATPTPAPAPTPAAPAPAPAPAAPLPASAAGGRYAVNVGSFSNLANARALADKLRAQGLPVTSESVDVNGKPAMRLRVGPYAERALAEAARLRAESVTGGSAAVIALDANAAAPAASAPAPATRAPAAASVGFAVQLGALSNEADATALRDKARAAGFTAFHQRIATERGVVWRVRVGPEADRAAAERLRDSVAAKLGLRDAIIVPHP
jgi:cell division septation protein DedD